MGIQKAESKQIVHSMKKVLNCLLVFITYIQKVIAVYEDGLDLRGDIWPQPLKQEKTNNLISLDVENLSFKIKSSCHKDIIDDNIFRYKELFQIRSEYYIGLSPADSNTIDEWDGSSKINEITISYIDD